MTRAWYVTHPDVLVDPDVPVPRWPLSERGRTRMARLLEAPWARTLQRVVSSGEQKAIDGAEILAGALGIPHHVRDDLGENDRSATGYLPPEEFWPVVEAFFARPEQSIRGWERAIDAQSRVAAAVQDELDRNPVPTAFVAHGGVGCLLQCLLAGEPISRTREQPGPPPGAPHGSGGGYYFAFEAPAMRLVHGWEPIDPD